MSSSAILQPNGNVLPRARAVKKPEEGTITPPLDRLMSIESSGRSTPIAEDAPPSAHSIATARKQARVRTRLFYTINYTPRVSHFDPKSDHHNFRGFFTLFWIALFIMVVTTALRNIKDTGLPLRVRVWGLLTANVWQLGLSDLAMVVSTGLVVPFHKLFRTNGWLRWGRGGMIVQSLFEAAWLVLWVNWPFMMRWTWTAQVFMTLHSLVFLMKMHSYAFYNGHLSETERRLAALDKPGSVSLDAAVRYPDPEPRQHPTHQHGGRTRSKSVSELREDLASELTSPLGHVTYPQNLTLGNYVDYIFCPTLCYELEYPRNKTRRWTELAAKTLAVFGCIFLLTLTSEEFILPVLSEASVQLHNVQGATEKSLILAETISMLLFPFMITFLLVFLVIFEYVLGAFAEITCFADRQFYSDWWNSCDWLEFSREWNVPVHHFLRRHVYFPSLSNFSQPAAMFITFLVSSIFHELVMSCITKKLRGYGFLAMMLQMPIVAVQQSRFFRGKKTLNNVFFWLSMIFGLSMVCLLLPPIS
ncbi:putative sterol o-acyltransferase (APE2) [Aspergillus clavatus NRRL 1]|uniref:O-acyltransferase n=1 Tax=Aspergillus clavatus (strain ATCC 1007 / CBS 513.65 / DSM 816 / NCTC 3887 / NRRL 1 / QM 1276 / 107) TaxID=344612 RepID=A1CR60_ASPCL|nr:sterol o-acyltransferase (APE2), putative [Aspergillus clavatus NRRL 1]EAW08131.1 sterol o-acyltransferase (APE2), putaitve [Aspergillus clavatus NRRL 1]